MENITQKMSKCTYYRVLTIEGNGFKFIKRRFGK